MRSIFHYYYFDGYKIDLFGYDPDSEKFDYSVETPYSCRIRRAKKQYNKNGELYINIITPIGEKKRLYLND